MNGLGFAGLLFLLPSPIMELREYQMPPMIPVADQFTLPTMTIPEING